MVKPGRFDWNFFWGKSIPKWQLIYLEPLFQNLIHSSRAIIRVRFQSLAFCFPVLVITIVKEVRSKLLFNERLQHEYFVKKRFKKCWKIVKAEKLSFFLNSYCFIDTVNEFFFHHKFCNFQLIKCGVTKFWQQLSFKIIVLSVIKVRFGIVGITLTKEGLKA